MISIDKLMKTGDKYMGMIGMRLVASFFCVSSYFLYDLSIKTQEADYNSLEFVRKSNLLIVGLYVFTIFLVFTIIRELLRRLKKESTVNTDAYAMAISFTCFAFLTLFKNNNFYFATGMVLCLCVMLYYLLKKDFLKELYKLSAENSIIIIITGAVIMCAFVGYLTVLRYRLYHTSTFDLGIAGQMYHYMKETFQPLTTCERDKLLSHFAVHFTPAYYLLLPVYFVFPYMETLLVSQPILLALGAIPLYLICRHREYKPVEATCFSLAYLFSTAVVAPNFYDFHETAFIPVLMFSFFYFMEKKKWVWMYIFLFLTLCCKEDVAVSMVCVGVFMYLSNKKDMDKKFHGIIVTLTCLAFFFTVTMMLDKFGEGLFSHRFNDLMADPGKGFLSEIIRTAFTNPGFIFSQSFASQDKFMFLLRMFLPLLFVPFFSNKGGRYLLLVPTFLVCMLPGYTYQHNIDFQYVHGMIPMIIYLAVLNLKDVKIKIRKYILPCIAIASIAFTFAHITPKLSYIGYYNNDRDKLAVYEKYLGQIPTEASVEAFHNFVPRLSSRKIIFMMTGNPEEQKWEPTDYVVLRVSRYMSEQDQEFYDKKVEVLKERGYVYAFGDEDYIAVYKLEVSNE